MKKIKILIILIIFVTCLFILNIDFTTRQAISRQVYTLRIPLYLKILDFYDRHYNYKWLVYRITLDKTNKEERLMAIFMWTIKNIIKKPIELKTIDDHVWHIIIRGYGAPYQFSDVFTTLCNYAKLNAFFQPVVNKDSTSKITLSFVKINKRWCVFDPYNGTYFINREGDFASVQDIANGNWLEKNMGNLKKSNFDYSDYFREILSIDFERSYKFSRANIQSPINRLIYGIKRDNF